MEKSKALSRAAALCSRSEQCESDVRKKLHTWLDDDSQADDIIRQLRQEGYIDDDRYARAYVHDKLLYNGWGRIKLRLMLRAKQLSDEAIDQALEQIDPQQYTATLEHIVKAKWRTVAQREQRQARAALLRHAAGRGFEPHLIARCINHLTGSSDDDEIYY